MRNTADIMGIPVDNVNMELAVQRIIAFLDEDKNHTIFTPNAEIMMVAHRDAEFKKILQSGDLVIADGAGVVLASKIIGKALPERVAGYDLTRRMLGLTTERPISFYLFGSKPGIAEAAAQNILKEYPGAVIAGCRDGYFKDEESGKIVAEINASGADVLLVALGAPKQEKWISQNRDILKVRISMGVGGSLDVISGNAERAPEFYCKHNLEWLYRLKKEPWRYKRMLDLPRYVLKAILYKIRKR